MLWQVSAVGWSCDPGWRWRYQARLDNEGEPVRDIFRKARGMRSRRRSVQIGRAGCNARHGVLALQPGHQKNLQLAKLPNLNPSPDTSHDLTRVRYGHMYHSLQAAAYYIVVLSPPLTLVTTSGHHTNFGRWKLHIVFTHAGEIHKQRGGVRTKS